MKFKLALIPIAAAAIAITAAPALAKSKKHHRVHHHGLYAAPYAQPLVAPAWKSRFVSDPSFGNRAGIDYARSTGRCVTDLGYGRFEYCGW